jgi:hypothetical protein
MHQRTIAKHDLINIRSCLIREIKAEAQGAQVKFMSPHAPYVVNSLIIECPSLTEKLVFQIVKDAAVHALVLNSQYQAVLPGTPAIPLGTGSPKAPSDAYA